MICAFAVATLSHLAMAPAFSGKVFQDHFFPIDQIALTAHAVVVARDSTQTCTWYEGDRKATVSFKSIGGVERFEAILWAEDMRVCVSVLQQTSPGEHRTIYALIPRKGKIQISPESSAFGPSKAAYKPLMAGHADTDSPHLRVISEQQSTDLRYPTGFKPGDSVWEPLAVFGGRNSKGECVGSLSYEIPVGGGGVSLTTSAIYWNANGQGRFLNYPRGYLSGAAEAIDENGRIAGETSKGHMTLFRALTESSHYDAEAAEATVWEKGVPNILPFAKTAGIGKMTSRGSYAMMFGPHDWILGRQQEFRSFDGGEKLQDFAVLWTGTRAYDINTLWAGQRKYVLCYIYGVNEIGQILCGSEDLRKQEPGPLVLLTPKP